MAYLFGVSLFCLLLATRLSGPFRAIPLLVAAPVLLAVIGSVLMSEFGLSIQTALLLACFALVVLIGLPLLITQIVTRRAEAVARERHQRLAALRDHLQG